MRHLVLVLLVACGSREGSPFDLPQTTKIEKVEKVEKVEERGEAITLDEGDLEPSVTDAAGRAYLVKLSATADTACDCKTEECGRSVVQSWQLALLSPSWNDYSLSSADKLVEEKQLQRMFMCAALSDPQARDNVARARTEAKAARTKLFALLDDPYDGESARAAIRAMKEDLRAMCACTTMVCIEKLQPRFEQPPIVTTDREVELVGQLVAGVMTCASSIVVDEALAGVE